jgi:hypothetical protein
MPLEGADRIQEFLGRNQWPVVPEVNYHDITYLSQFPLKSLFSHLMLDLAYRALNCDNLQPTICFVELFIKYLDLPPPVKWLLANKLTQKMLPLSRYAW